MTRAPWPGTRRSESEAQVQEKLKAVMAMSGQSSGRGLLPAARVKTIGGNFLTNFLGRFSRSGLRPVSPGPGGGASSAALTVLAAEPLSALFGGHFWLAPLYHRRGSPHGPFITSVAGVGIYYCLVPYCSGQAMGAVLALGTLFGIGSFCGMYIGAIFQNFVKANIIQIGLGAIIAGLALKYLIGFFLG